MAIIFTARLHVRDWRALLRLSDETLLLYARATGARRYQLYRDTHDATEALLLVEAANATALRPVSDALLRLGDATLGGRMTGERTEAVEGRLWEPAGGRTMDEAHRYERQGGNHE
jgi:hypothetical protein